MVHAGLVSCHSSMEKSIFFTSMVVQMLLTNRLLCMLVIIGQLHWDPSATHFPIPEVVMDNIVCRAMTHVEFYGNFINSDSPVVIDLLLDLLFHCLSCHANGLPLRCSSLTFCLLFWNLSTHSYTLPWLKQLSPYWTFILLYILEGLTPSDHKKQITFSASWHWSGHVVWAIAQAHTARSSRPLYGVLLRSHFLSRNKIFRCVYFSMHFRIKFMLFNDSLVSATTVFIARWHCRILKSTVF